MYFFTHFFKNIFSLGNNSNTFIVISMKSTTASGALFTAKDGVSIYQNKTQPVQSSMSGKYKNTSSYFHHFYFFSSSRDYVISKDEYGEKSH